MNSVSGYIHRLAILCNKIRKSTAITFLNNRHFDFTVIKRLSSLRDEIVLT